MWFVFLLLGVVAALMVWAAVIDIRSRRRGVRGIRIDRRAARDQAHVNESDLRMRSNDQGFGGFNGGGF